VGTKLTEAWRRPVQETCWAGIQQGVDSSMLSQPEIGATKDICFSNASAMLLPQGQRFGVGSVSLAEHPALSPEIRSWLDNCLVPILVEEYLRETMQKGCPRKKTGREPTDQEDA
jgi:hypothetical protein